MKTKQKKEYGTDFLDMGEVLVGKEMFEKILSTPLSDNEDDDLEEEDDELTEEQIKYMKKMLDKFKK